MMDTPTLSTIADLFVQDDGTAPAAIARAPGRVEFIGNHERTRIPYIPSLNPVSSL